MSRRRLRSIAATALTLMLAGSLGPLLTGAAARPLAPAALVRTSRQHAVAGARRVVPAHGQAHHRTRGGRGIRTAAAPTAAHGSAAAGRAGQIAAVLASACQNTEVTPTPGNLELVRAAILCLINRERAQNGETPLALSDKLQQAAEVHNREMIAGNYFEHVTPSGETPVDRIRAAGYIPAENVGYVIGENLAWGTLGLGTPQAIADAWIASPGHLANILEAQYSETGIAIVPQVPSSLSGGATGATYTQEFGVILH
jgi:uncharacterized protein YkwD